MVIQPVLPSTKSMILNTIQDGFSYLFAATFFLCRFHRNILEIWGVLPHNTVTLWIHGIIWHGNLFRQSSQLEQAANLGPEERSSPGDQWRKEATRNDIWLVTRKPAVKFGIRLFNMIMPLCNGHLLFVFVLSHRVFRRGRHGQSETNVFGSLAQTPAAKNRLVDGAGVYPSESLVLMGPKIRKKAVGMVKARTINHGICTIFVPYQLFSRILSKSNKPWWIWKKWNIEPHTMCLFSSSFKVAANKLVTMEEHTSFNQLSMNRVTTGLLSKCLVLWFNSNRSLWSFEGHSLFAPAVRTASLPRRHDSMFDFTEVTSCSKTLAFQNRLITLACLAWWEPKPGIQITSCYHPFSQRPKYKKIIWIGTGMTWG